MPSRALEGLTLLSISSLDRSTLNDRVYDDLRQMIIAGRLRPGQVISIRSLAEVLGVSSMPVRGALQRLVAEGAIESRANRTFALPVLNPQSLMEIAHIRSELEGMAVEAAVGNLDETDFKYLTDINHQMFDGTPDWTNYLELNRIFHFHIYRKAGMPRLLRLIEGMWLQIGPLLNFVATSSALAGGSETHRDLVRALAEKDARGARVTIQRDILVAARQIVVTLTEQRDGSDRAVAER